VRCPRGRRCHVDLPYDQRAVGCAMDAHVCDRRRRRYLRHRRLRQHLLPGRVGEYRRRCGPDSGGIRGTPGVRIGHSCVLTVCVRVPRRCADPAVARRVPAVLRAQPQWADSHRCVCVVSSVGGRRGRRCHLDLPYDQRAVGWARWAHIRDRRRRRNLRHRRRRQPHLIQRRVREPRRRCGPDSRGECSAAGVMGEVRVTREAIRATAGVPQGYSWGTKA
jgi:hypothetical protein